MEVMKVEGGYVVFNPSDKKAEFVEEAQRTLSVDRLLSYKNLSAYFVGGEWRVYLNEYRPTLLHLPNAMSCEYKSALKLTSKETHQVASLLVMRHDDYELTIQKEYRLQVLKAIRKFQAELESQYQEVLSELAKLS